jgi:hypothetical protein
VKKPNYFNCLEIQFENEAGIYLLVGCFLLHLNRTLEGLVVRLWCGILLEEKMFRQLQRWIDGLSQGVISQVNS